MSLRTALLTSLLSAIVLTGCNKPKPTVLLEKPDFAKPLAPGELALRTITDPALYPDFSRDHYNRGSLVDSIDHSIAYLHKPSSQQFFPYGEVTHAQALASLERFRDLLASGASMEQINAAIVQDFDVYESVGYDGEGMVYFTGYYCPIFDGRRQQTGEFRYPLFRLPHDLRKDALGRTQGQYRTRREIEQSGALAGQEIAWLKDPFEAYVVTVQGSAKLRQEDGSLFELGYAGNNGYAYESVGRMLVEDGKLDKNELSLQSMIAYFRAHPEDVQNYCWKNDRYVFFQELPGGPFGSIGVPVAPFRSIATDKEVFPRACLAFADTQVPRLHDGQITFGEFASFVLDQDTGGAIRAAGRCDIFMGIGEQAEALAGRTGSEGRLYYVFIKKERMIR
jgi:membrane-bound lytic murein transglycosylase A